MGCRPRRARGPLTGGRAIRTLPLLLTLLIAPAVRADVTDPAELFPPRVVAYAEVARPADFAAGVAAVFGGDPTKVARDRFDKLTAPFEAAGAKRAAFWSLLTSPEFLAEAKRLRAAAVAVPGFTTRGEPRLVAVFLLGESHAAGLAARTFLTTEPDLGRVATADGVPVYQHRPAGRKPAAAEAQPAPAAQKELESPDAWEPTYAYTPGLFVVGTDVVGVSQVVTRFTGQQGGPTLAGADSFARARWAHDRSGVFFYVDLPTLVEWHDDAARRGGRVDPGWLSLVRFAVNPKAVKSFAGSLALGREAVALTVEAEVAAGAPSPLAAVLTGPAVGPTRLRFVAGQPMWVAGVAFPPANRAKLLLALADAVAKADGALGETPSEAVARADRGAGPKVADLLGAASAVTVFVPAKSAGTLPVVVVHTDSDADAEKWEKGWPKLVRLLGGTGDDAEPSSEIVDGVRVRTLSGEGVPTLHAARFGTAIAFGPDRKLVAEAATGKGAERPVPAGALAAGVIRPDLFYPVAPAPKAANPDDGTSRPAEPWSAGLGQLARPLPPISASLVRSGNRLRFEARLDESAKSLPAGVSAFLDWYAKQPAASPTPPFLPRGVIDR